MYFVRHNISCRVQICWKMSKSPAEKSRYSSCLPLKCSFSPVSRVIMLKKLNYFLILLKFIRNSIMHLPSDTSTLTKISNLPHIYHVCWKTIYFDPLLLEYFPVVWLLSKQETAVRSGWWKEEHMQ